MPYENEYSCRLRDPDDFQDDSFRRTTREHEGKEYSVIQAKLKGEDMMTDQAFRYAKDTWSEGEARGHCQTHDGSFEAMMKKIGGRTMKFSYRNDKNAEAISRIWGKPLDKPDWYTIKAQGEDETEIIIYDVIGWPFIIAEVFIRDLATIKTGKILVRINSPGGDVFDGVAIFNALSAHKAKITTRIEGLAASIASVIALAGSEVQAYKNTMYMIHDPWAFAIGNQYDLRETADILEKIGKNMIDIYADNSNVGKRDLKQMMQDETWFTAKEAQERGFIDTVLDAGGDVKARFDLSMFAHAPADLSSKETTDDGVIDKRTLERALRDVGLSQSKAKAFVARGYSAIDESATSLTKNLKEGMSPEVTEEARAQQVKAIKQLTKITRR